MTKIPKRRAPRDLNQIAKRIVDSATAYLDDDKRRPDDRAGGTDAQSDTAKRRRCTNKPAQKSSRK